MCVCVLLFPPLFYLSCHWEKNNKKKHTDHHLFVFFFISHFITEEQKKKLLHWSSFYAPQLVCFQSLCRQTEAEPAAWTPCSFNWNHDRRFDFIIPVANPWNRQLIANPLGIKQDRRIFFFFYTQREGKILKINKTSQRG